MKAVILAGGYGTRISEETHLRPKPMVEIGGKPIIWHIMKQLSQFNINDFIVCCGYKSYVIKEYFANYSLHMSDVTFELDKSRIHVHRQKAESWKVTLVDTGENTMTGGRLKRVREYLDETAPFIFTYGDGLADIDINQLIKFHYSHNKMATVTAVAQPPRYGAIELEQNKVVSFSEKSADTEALINGGFFVLEPDVLGLIEGDDTHWEKNPVSKLVDMGELTAYRHYGFWQSMDTLREKQLLENLWQTGNAPWKNW